MQSSTSIKFDLNGVRRRISIDSTSRITFENLKGLALKLFSKDLNDSQISFYYIDDDNDEVRFSSQDEIVEALDAIISSRRKCFLIFVTQDSNLTKQVSYTDQKFVPLLCSLLESVDDTIRKNRISVSFHDYSIIKKIILEQAKLKQSLSTNKTNSESSSNCFENFLVHENITCSVCGVCPIRGIRYKSVIQDDFDICEDCEKKSDHKIALIKIYHPKQAPKSIVTVLKEGHHHVHHQEKGMAPVHHQEKGMAPVRAKLEANDAVKQRTGNFGGRLSNLSRWHEVPSRATNNSESSHWRRGQDLDLDNSTSSLTTSATTDTASIGLSGTSSIATSSNGKLMARFVRDVTLPNGWSVAAESIHVKTWAVRNDGSQPWPEGVELVHEDGDVISADTCVPVAAAGVGEEVLVSVTLTCPRLPGRYVSYWRLRVPSRNSSQLQRQSCQSGMFGQRIWADILVVEKSKDQEGREGAVQADKRLQEYPFSEKCMNSPLPTRLKDIDCMNAPANTTSSCSMDKQAVEAEYESNFEKLSDLNASMFSLIGSSLVSSDIQVAGAPDLVNVDQNDGFPTSDGNILESTFLDEGRYLLEVTADNPDGDCKAKEGPSGDNYVVGEDIWKRELRLFAEMGFTKKSVIVPLLAAHFEEPSPCEDTPINPDSLSRCLAVLLADNN